MNLLVAMALVMTATAPVLQIEVDGAQVRVTELAAPATCTSNRLLPDPSSRHIALWTAPRDLRANIGTNTPGDFIVADLPADAAAEGVQSFAVIGAGVRVEPLRWSARGDRLLVRAHNNGALLFDPAGRHLVAAPEFDPLWTLTRIEATSHGDLDFYRRPETLRVLRRIAHDGEPMRAVATVGPASAAFLVFRLGDGSRLRAYEGARSWDTGVRIAFASAPLLPPGRGRPLFLGDQTGHSSFLPYALPLIDRATGRVAGRYGLERIELANGRIADLGPVFHQLMSIRDATANGDTVIALVDLERELRIVRVRGAEIRSWHVCDKWGLQLGSRQIPGPDSLPVDTPVQRSVIRLAPGEASATPGAFALLYRPARADGRLVVYFHGGPALPLAETTVPQVVSGFAAQGVSVLAVEYSGMLGGGLSLSERLPRFGMRALREDVAAVTRWVRQSGFRNAYVLADSFGGAPALVAAIDHPDDYAHIFLRAPMLALRRPEQSVRRGNFFGGQVAPRSQLEFEETVYGGAGGRTRFGADLRAYVRRLHPSPRISFYFGTFDPVSAVSDLPPAFSGDRSVMIVPARHEAVGADQEVWHDILANMGPAAR